MKCKINLCERDAHTCGWCASHYRRVARTGSANELTPLSGSAQTPLQRLENKSIQVPFCDCHLWLGASVPRGYGVMFFQGRQQYAHRVSWQIAYGPIPEGLHILHSCDVPACINPTHLSPGTQKENIQDMVAKGRGSYINHARGKNHHMSGGGFKGEDHPNRKLNRAQVDEIRIAYKPGIRQIDLAKKYGVKQAQVSRIVRGESWV